MARVLISMSNDFLSRVDNVASSEQRTRSELIREALRVYIKRNRTSRLVHDYQYIFKNNTAQYYNCVFCP